MDIVITTTKKKLLKETGENCRWKKVIINKDYQNRIYFLSCCWDKILNTLNLKEDRSFWFKVCRVFNL